MCLNNWGKTVLQFGLWVHATSFLANNQSALLDKLSCFWALAWSNQVPITSPVNTCSLCVTFTMFCTSFLTTKTQLPLLVSNKFSSINGAICKVLNLRVLSAVLMNFLSSFPVWNFSLNLLASRYDESSSHPYLRAGWTHRASQGQRQPQALPGIWGMWASKWQRKTIVMF